MKNSKFALIMLLVSIAASIIITYKVYANDIFAFDQSAAAFFLTVFPEQTQPFFKLITIMGSKTGIILIGISMIFWLWFKKKNLPGVILVLVAVALGNEFNNLLKDIIARPRPELNHFDAVDSYSFPSGHAMVGIILYMVVGYFLMKELKSSSAKIGAAIGLVLLTFLIGISRIILNVHYPSDVFAGFSWGYIWVYVLIIGYEGITNKKNIITKTNTDVNTKISAR